MSAALCLRFLNYTSLREGRCVCAHPSAFQATSFGIREGRCQHYVVGIRNFVSGDETVANAAVYFTVRRAWLLRKGGEVSHQEILLEVLARVGRQFLAQLRTKLVEGRTTTLVSSAISRFLDTTGKSVRRRSLLCTQSFGHVHVCRSCCRKRGRDDRGH